MTAIVFPREWTKSDYEWFIDDDKPLEISYRYDPSGNLGTLQQKLDELKADLELKKLKSLSLSEETRERQLKQTEQTIEEIEANVELLVTKEREKIAHCEQLGMDYDFFKKLMFLKDNPNCDKVSSIYVIRQKGSNIYKIGISNCPERRLSEVNTGNPFGGELVIYYTGICPYEKEKMLHDHFGYCRLRPTAEWFELDAMDLKSIEKTFEQWLDQDTGTLQYLGYKDISLGIYKMS